MTQKTILLCDRCSEEIPEKAMTVTEGNKAIRLTFLYGRVYGFSDGDSIDLCSKCHMGFMHWLREKNRA